MRHRRTAECRQVDALQRADGDGGGAGGELSVLHHRAERRRGRRARSAAGQARGDCEVGTDHSDPADLRRYRRPRARRVEGRRPRQPVPRHHPRGRCDRACGALLRGFRHHARRRQDRSDRRHRDHRNRADAGRPRQPREARRQPDARRPRATTRKRRNCSTSSSARWCCCARASPRGWSSASWRKSAPSACSG